MGGDAGDFFRRPGREDARRERARARVDRENVAKWRRREKRAVQTSCTFLSSFLLFGYSVCIEVNR